VGPSAIGLSTYSFFWQWHETAPRPLSLAEIVAKTASWDVDLLQLCDYPALDRYDAAQAADLAAIGGDLGVAYELGTRGLDTAHLLHYLELAGRLDVTLVRSMVKSEEIADAPELLAKVVPAYEDAGVTLALETYEQIPTRTLVDLVTETIARLREGGLSAIVVEQNLHVAVSLADRVAIMTKGEIAYRATTEEFRGARAVAQSLLGVS